MQTLKTNADGYGYKYTDLAGVHKYLEDIKASYYQYIEIFDGNDYIMTVPTIDGKELAPRRGCRVVQAIFQGKSNPAQEQGSALTYARRYSLLMAFGLATEDDDAETLTRPITNTHIEKVPSYQKDKTESPRVTQSPAGVSGLATPAQISAIRNMGGEIKEGLTKKGASELISELNQR